MSLVFELSAIDDGNMFIPEDQANKEVVEHRRTFLAQYDITLDQATRLNISYDSDDFCRYFEVSAEQLGKGMEDGAVRYADALITKDKNHALFLPVADCVATILYDPVNEVLMLAHLGRHSVEQYGGRNTVQYLIEKYGSKAENILVWLSPAPGKNAYPLFAFDKRAMKDVVHEQLESAGIVEKNITDNTADTAIDPLYYSHSEFLQGHRDVDGRYAMVAMLK
jgi:copper oxidase (laccase) domain-containing protein